MLNGALNLKRIIISTLAVYIALVVSFYFLAGDQLRYRDSSGNVDLLPAESGTVEMSQGAVIEQNIRLNIQRLNSVSVQFGVYYRQNSGTVIMELWRGDGLLLQQSYDAADIQEGMLLTLSSDTPIEDVYDVPLTIRIYGDSEPGAAVTPLMNTTQPAKDGFSLYLNGEQAEGMLCFSAYGTDSIWMGLHYWELAAALGVLLALLFFVVWYRYRRGKRSFIVSALLAVKKYRFLIRQLVSRDFKTKYKRSVLGIFWSFLNPLLMMLIQYFVFSAIFKSNIPNFAAYLIIGTVMFNFFSESCGSSLTSILGNAGLITKVYMPKYIYPLSRTLSALVNLAISIIPMLIVCLVTGVRLKKSAILALFFFACLFIFCLGIGMLLAASMVFFRDTLFLWNVLSMVWMYATPIFYPETILPDKFRIVLLINPLYYFLKSARMCLMDGISPEPVMYIKCFLIALVTLLAGAAVFCRKQDKFVLYL